MTKTDTASKLNGLASKHWTNKNPKRLDPKLLSQIYGTISGIDSLSRNNTNTLHSLKYLENYLWPLFHPDLTDEHVLSILILSDLQIETLFLDSERLEILYFRVMSLFSSTPELLVEVKIHMVHFMDNLLRHISHEIIRKLFKNVFTIIIWEPLTYKDDLLAASASLKETYLQLSESIDTLSKDEKAKFILQKQWLYNLLVDHIKLLINQVETTKGFIPAYTDAILSLVATIISQKATRKYANELIKQLNYLPILKMLNLNVRSIEVLERYIYYLINEFGSNTDRLLIIKEESADFYKAQYSLYSNFPDEFRWILSASSTNLEGNLQKSLKTLSPDLILKICNLLSVELALGIDLTTAMMIEFIVCKFKNKISCFPSNEALSTFPTEISFASPPVLDLPISTGNFLDLNDLFLRGFYAEQNKIDKTIFETVTSSVNNPKKHIKLSEDIVVKTVSRSPSIGVEFEVSFSYPKKNTELKQAFESIKEGDFVFMLRTTSLESPSADSIVESMRVATLIEMINAGEKGDSSSEQRKMLLSFKRHQVGEASDIKNFNCMVKGFSRNSVTKLNVIRNNLTSNLIDPPDWALDYLLGNSYTKEDKTKNNGFHSRILKFGHTFSSFENLKAAFGDDITFEPANSEPSTKKRKLNSLNPIDITQPPFAVEFTGEEDEGGASIVHRDTDLSSWSDNYNFTPLETQNIISGTFSGLTLLDSANTNVVSRILMNIGLNFPDERTLVLAKDDTHLIPLYESLKSHHANVFFKPQWHKNKDDTERISAKIDQIVQISKTTNLNVKTPEDAFLAYKTVIEPSWLEYILGLKKSGTSTMVENYPFSENINVQNGFIDIVRDYCSITGLINKLRGLTLNSVVDDMRLPIVNSKIILISTQIFYDYSLYLSGFDNIIVLDKDLKLELASCLAKTTKRIITV